MLIDENDVRVALGNTSEYLGEVLSSDAFRDSRKFILVDEQTHEHCLPVVLSTTKGLEDAEVLEIESGEQSKTVEVATQLWKVLIEMEADRNSLLINVGGGVVGDLGGFVASTYKRGIRFVNIPTSLLAQVDASIGGKTGIDLGMIKNAVGTFRSPYITIVDTQYLKTLPTHELNAGLAEIIKHALIADKDYWERIRDTKFENIGDFEQLVEPSIRIKQEIVSQDPQEKGLRKVLNFGHTIGHGLESFSLESGIMNLRHGEAIAIGMVCEAYLSHRMGWLSEKDLHSIQDVILPRYPVFPLDEVHFHRVLELMRNDKKNQEGSFRFSLLKGIGNCRYDAHVNAQDVMKALKYYRNLVC